MDLSALVQNFGFPVALAVYFIWRDYQTSQQHKQDLKDIATKSLQAIDAGTEAIKDSTATIEKNNDALTENTNTLNSVKGVLLAKGNKNGMANGS